MDWQISPLAKVSFWNETPFEADDEVTTLLLVSEEGQILRYDLHTRDLGDALPHIKGQELGRWTRVLKPASDRDDSGAERLQTSESLFFALFGQSLPQNEEDNDVMPELEKDHSVDSMEQETREALQHVLALLLERKRVLRAVGKRKAEGTQDYLHVKSRKTFQVPVLPLDNRLVQRLMGTIGDLVL